MIGEFIKKSFDKKTQEQVDLVVAEYRNFTESVAGETTYKHLMFLIIKIAHLEQEIKELKEKLLIHET